MSDQPLIKKLTEDDAGQRLDVVLAKHFPDYSRSRLKTWIQQGQVRLDGKLTRPKVRVVGDEELSLLVKADASEETCLPEPVELDVLHQDASILVINKPAGRVVHPAAGHHGGTLQNGLLYHFPELAAIPRAGIVHRLDKDTTGLMVVARTLPAHHFLVDHIQRHEVTREYQAVVHGVMTGGGCVDQPIGRHPRDRIKMAVRENGRTAVTHYRLIQRFRAHSHLRVQLETGRTHQIRVHMAYLRHALVGDPVYAGRQRLPPHASDGFRATLQAFRRQALHAWRLSFVHPADGRPCRFEAPLPADMEALLRAMQTDLDTQGDDRQP